MIILKVNKLLNDKNKSIYWLAKKTSLAYSTVYKIVNDNSQGINFNTLEEIMTALDITSFDEILEIVPGEEE